MRETINLTKFLSEELKNKYEFFVKGDFPTTANMSVDSLFPKLFNDKINSIVVPSSHRKFPTSSFAISEFVANALEVRQAHVSELCEILGYSEQRVKRILLDVKRKKLDLYLVGLGGTGSNFNHWMSELCNWTHSINIFNKIHVSDPDKYTLSNIVRLPNDFRLKSRNSMKADSFDNSNNITSKIEVHINADHAGIYGRGNVEALTRTIFYGAPGINTRKELSDAPGCRFISATHAGDECQLFLNPPQDSDIQMETYGRINLSVFFMNHLKMTLSFLEFLTHFETINWSMSAEIMEFDFKKEYNEENLLTNERRLYRFPCMTSIELATIEARNAAAGDGELVGEHDQPMPAAEVPEADIAEALARAAAETANQQVTDALRGPTIQTRTHIDENGMIHTERVDTAVAPPNMPPAPEEAQQEITQEQRDFIAREIEGIMNGGQPA